MKIKITTHPCTSGDHFHGIVQFTLTNTSHSDRVAFERKIAQIRGVIASGVEDDVVAANTRRAPTRNEARKTASMVALAITMALQLTARVEQGEDDDQAVLFAQVINAPGWPGKFFGTLN